MPLKSQFKLIITSLIVLLLVPIVLYFLAENEVGQFLINFSGYFGAIISIFGVYLLLLSYFKHQEKLAYEVKKQLERGYFYIEKMNTSPELKNISTEKPSKLLVTDNFKHYKSEEPMNFYHVNLVTQAKMILNLEISIEYLDLSFTDRLYIARLEADTEIFIPQRLSQTVNQELAHVELKKITLNYETLAGELMCLVFEEKYKVMSCYGEDRAGKQVKLYTEYLNGTELLSLN